MQDHAITPKYRIRASVRSLSISSPGVYANYPPTPTSPLQGNTNLRRRYSMSPPRVHRHQSRPEPSTTPFQSTWGMPSPALTASPITPSQGIHVSKAEPSQPSNKQKQISRNSTSFIYMSILRDDGSHYLVDLSASSALKVLVSNSRTIKITAPLHDTAESSDRFTHLLQFLYTHDEVIISADPHASSSVHLPPPAEMKGVSMNGIIPALFVRLYIESPGQSSTSFVYVSITLFEYDDPRHTDVYRSWIPTPFTLRDVGSHLKTEMDSWSMRAIDGRQSRIA